MRFSSALWLAIVFSLSLFQNLSVADIVVDQGTIDVSTDGGFESSTFTLSALQIADTELFTDFFVIDDGVEIVVNGTSLFLSADTSQFGAQDFVPTAVQPNDIADPWTPNSNDLPRLTVLADSTGAAFSGSVDTTTTNIVDYQPEFAVANFNSLLVAGSNTIQFVNHNGSDAARLQGAFTVTVRSVPEPTSLAVLGAFPLVMALRRRRRS